MKLLLNVRDSASSVESKQLKVSNKSLRKDLKILTKNVALLVKIKEKQQKDAENLHGLKIDNVGLKDNVKTLQESANQLIKELSI